MSSSTATGTVPKNGTFKSRIPVPKSKLPVPVANNVFLKNKSSATSLEKKISFLPQKSIKPPTLSKDKCSVQKLPEKLQIPLAKSEKKLINNSNLVHSNKGAVKPVLQYGRLDKPNKLVKPASNPLTVPEQKLRDSKVVSSVIVRKNSRLNLNSDSSQYGLKKAVTKGPSKLTIKEPSRLTLKEPSRLTLKKDNCDLIKKSEVSNINLLKGGQKVQLKACVKLKNDNSDKIPDLIESDDKQSILNAEYEENLKENKRPGKANYFAAQVGIKFEANEFYRNQILSGKELSPSTLKQTPGLKLSFAKRSSIYHQEFIVPSDPYKEALRAIENSLSVKKDRPSVVRESSKVLLSPFKDRNSFYTPCANPKVEAMRSIEAFKLKLLQKKALKSAKKVSFNLNVQECSPKDGFNVKLTPFRGAECALTQINEKSEENTPNSPESKVNEVSSIIQGQNTGQNSESYKNEHISFKLEATSENTQEHDSVESNNLHEELHEFSKCCTPPVTKSIPNSDGIHCDLISTQSAAETKEICASYMFHNIRKLDSEFSSPPCVNNKVMDRTSIPNISRMSFHALLSNNTTQSCLKAAKPTVCTPRPISLFGKSSLIDISSPEFLTDGIKNRFLSDCAPIQTPLFLRSLAKCSARSLETDLSPVRVKLNFTDDKDSPRKEAPTKSLTSVISESITTTQMLLDDLADQECHLYLMNENGPVLCGRYLQNPIALTLTEGDDMHFIPIKF